MRSHFLRAKGSGLIYVGSATAAVLSSTNYTLNVGSLSGGIASSPAAGDLIVICNGLTWTSNISGNSGVVTSGFTQLTALYSNDTRDAIMWVSYKIAAGNEGNITLRANGSDSTYASCGIAHVWRNVNQTTPIDVTTTTATGTNASRPNVPSVTPVTQGAVVLGCGYGTRANDGGAALTAPSGVTEVVQAINAATAAAGGAAVVAAYRSWMSGAYDMAAFTGGSSSTSDSWCAAAVVIRPAR